MTFILLLCFKEQWLVEQALYFLPLSFILYTVRFTSCFKEQWHVEQEWLRNAAPSESLHKQYSYDSLALSMVMIGCIVVIAALILALLEQS